MFEKFKSYLNTEYNVFDIGSSDPTDGVLFRKYMNRQCILGKTSYIFTIFGDISIQNIRNNIKDENGNSIAIYLYLNNDISAGQNYWFSI